MGPGAGEHGGSVIAEGTPQAIQKNGDSLTGKYLSGELAIAVPQARTQPNSDRWLKIEGASGNNLKNVNLDLPVGLFVCVTGVSGSGKSTLINETLYLATARHLDGSAAEPASYRNLDGLAFFDKVIEIDQSPMAGRRGRIRRLIPVCSHQSASCLQCCPISYPRLQAGPVFLQRQGRPLRGL